MWVSFFIHYLHPSRCFPLRWSLSVSIWSSQADPLTLRNLNNFINRDKNKNKTDNKTKNNNTTPARILDAWQRGGFREAYGDPPPPSGLEACQTQAQDSCRYLQSSDEIRVPPARRSRRSCLGGAHNSNYGRPRAQILETLCKLRTPGAQNLNSGHLQAQILDTLCKLRSPGAQKSISGHPRAQINHHDHHHPSSWSSSSSSSSQHSINPTKFKRVDPQDDDF